MASITITDNSTNTYTENTISIDGTLQQTYTGTDITVAPDVHVVYPGRARYMQYESDVSGAQVFQNDTYTKMTFTDAVPTNTGSGYVFSDSRFTNTSGSTKVYLARLYGHTYSSTNPTYVKVPYLCQKNVSATTDQKLNPYSIQYTYQPVSDVSSERVYVEGVYLLHDQEWFEVGFYQNSGDVLKVGWDSSLRYDISNSLQITEL